MDIGINSKPGLRNIALTAPYMHNGMFRTLEEVVDYYDNPTENGEKPVNMDSLLLHPLVLRQEKKRPGGISQKTLTDHQIHHEDRTKNNRII